MIRAQSNGLGVADTLSKVRAMLGLLYCTSLHDQLRTVTKTLQAVTLGIVRNFGLNKIRDSNSWLEISFWSELWKSS